MRTLPMRPLLAIVIAITATAIYTSTIPPAASASLANVWLATSAANNCSGGRSATPIDYSTAVSGNNVCTTFARACSAATGGDTVAVKAGNYPQEDAPSGSIKLSADCSDGTASDFDPTAVAAGTAASAPANWVTFTAEGGCTNDSITMRLAHLFLTANTHVFFEGTSARCFYINDIEADFVGDTGLNAQNAIFHNVDVFSFECFGCKNFWIDSFVNGPELTCDNLGAQAQCQDPGYGVFESRWATRGNQDLSGTQFPKIVGNSNTAPDNIVVSNGVSHDQQTRNAGLYHGGCGFFATGTGKPDNSFIIRNVKCERVNIQGWFIESSSSGITWENTQESCITYPIDDGTNNPSKKWDLCTSPSKVSFLVKDTTTSVSNILIRYNSWVGGIDLPSTTTTYSNVRIIGNIYAGESTCPSAGVVWDYNATTSTNCAGATNNSSTSAPWTDSDATSASDLPVGDLTTPGGDGQGSMTDFHLSGSPGSFGFENSITPTSSDYALTIDMDGAARTSGSRDPGADER